MAKRKSIVQRENEMYWIENGIDIIRRKIMLDKDIDDSTIGWIIRAVDMMSETDPNSPIEITISSCGGFVYDGLALYDALVDSPCKIITKATGAVMSIGLIIYLAGDERIATERVTFMQHATSITMNEESRLYNLKVEAAELERIESITSAILAEKSDRDIKWWKREIEYKDRYYNKKRAFELGIVTKL